LKYNGSLIKILHVIIGLGAGGAERTLQHVVVARNEVRLKLHALAYNLGVFVQGTDLPEEMADWSLTSLQTRLIKIGARVVRHARATIFQLAEVAVSGNSSRVFTMKYRRRIK
jgi:hypothetical protein